MAIEVKTGPNALASLREAMKRAMVLTGLAPCERLMSTGLKDKVGDDTIFEQHDGLIALAQKSFTKAAKDAVAENERLGIKTHGTGTGTPESTRARRGVRKLLGKFKSLGT